MAVLGNKKIKELIGNVVSTKMQNTLTVSIPVVKMHPIYKKYVKQSAKYSAHDEANVFRIGDFVSIEECAPISKRKSFKVITDPSTLGRELTAKVTKDAPASAGVAKVKASAKTGAKKAAKK